MMRKMKQNESSFFYDLSVFDKSKRLYVWKLPLWHNHTEPQQQQHQQY